MIPIVQRHLKEESKEALIKVGCKVVSCKFEIIDQKPTEVYHVYIAFAAGLNPPREWLIRVT